MWGPTEFIVGRHVGLVGRFTIGLIESSVSTVRDELWSLVAADAPIDDILDRLSVKGLKALPAFGLAQVDEGTVRVVARGSATILVDFSDGTNRVIDPSEVRTWIEEAFADVVAVSIGLVDSEIDVTDQSGARGSVALDRYVVLAGSVPACRLIRRFDEQHPLAEAARAEWSPAPISRWSSDAIAEPEVPVGVEAVEPPELDRDDRSETDQDVADGSPLAETSMGEMVAADSGAAESGAPVAGIPLDSNETIAAQEFDTLASPDVVEGGVDADPQPDEAATGDYDFIYGHTVARSVEGAAVRADEESSPSGLISFVPPSDPVDPSPPVATSEQAGDHDGLTVTRADLAVMRASPAATAPPVPGANEVLAIRCELGHANPPQASSCRNCGRPVLAGAPVSVQRPPLGVLVFSNGDRVVVDRNILVGRNPRVAGTVSGELPRVVKFEDLGKGLSRTHAEVRLEGWQMLLEDLQSTNGTEVTLPGQAPRRLHAGEPASLVPGTRVDFGGEVQCTVETVS